MKMLTAVRIFPNGFFVFPFFKTPVEVSISSFSGFLAKKSCCGDSLPDTFKNGRMP